MPLCLADIMTQHVTVVGVDDTVDNVECHLGTRKHSCVPVIDPEGLCFGIITTNDIIKFHIQNRNAKKVRAWEICSHLLIEVAPSMPVRDATLLMIKNRIHHLVVTQGNTIQGIVSSIDLLEAYATTDPQS